MTLGCKVNQYESEAIAAEFIKNDFTIGRFSEKCGVYIINTCTVTSESDRKTRQMIRRAARHNPKAYILVTGCYSQLNPAKTAGIDGVDFICGNSNKLRLVDAVLGLIASGEKNDVADIKIDDINSAPLEPMTIKSPDRTRAFVKIEDGCDNRCTYCIVPLARGPVRSKPIADVVLEVKGLVDSGYHEVVLTGIETASYGKDFTEDGNLAELLCEVDKIDGIERIRLGSLDPSAIRPEFIDKIATLRHITTNFHLSMQSGSSRVLAAMKRKYNAETAEKNIAYMREKIPGVTFTADFIVGFPGETEEEFEQTEDFIRRVGFMHLHVFSYSKRPGTAAAEMDNQIPDYIKNVRLQRLETIRQEVTNKLSESYIGKQKEVLFELCEDGKATGHTPEFLEVTVSTPDNLHRKVKNVKLNGFNGTVYTGYII